MLTETNTPFFFIENPILYQRYLDSFPPKEAYYYFPKGEEIIIPNKKNPEKSLRRIFFNTEFNEHEKKWLIEFNKIIEQHPENKLPDYWNDSYNLKYIYSENCKLQKAYERMINNINHQKNFFPLTFTPKDKVLTIINMGFCYIFGRDHQFRPILIINTGILIKRIDEFSTDDLIRSGMFIIEFIKNKMFINGQIENLLMIINFEDTNLISLPDKLKKTFMEIDKNFVSILYKTYFIGVNFIIKIILKIVFAFLEKATAKKVVVLDNKKDKRILENISPNNLEKRFGGEAENAPDISIPEIRLPMIALIKKQLKAHEEVLFHVDDYMIQRNMFGNYCVNIHPSLCCCCGLDNKDVTALSDSIEWQQISAL
jgi:hypothetical protein